MDKPTASSLRASTGGSAGRVVVDVPGFHASQTPLSPWLRLAHRRRLARRADEVPLRRILDFEILLVLDGELWLWVEPARGALSLGPGSLAFIPPGLVHTWGNTANTHLAAHFDLCAQPNLAPLDNLVVLDGRVSYWPARSAPMVRWTGFDGQCTPIVQHLADITPWRQCLEELLTVSAGRTSAALNLDEQSAVQARLIWALREWIRIAANETANDPRWRIRALLRELDPTQRIRIDALARQVNMSSTSFRVAFRAVTGQAPRQWLEARRIDLAAHRLIDTNLPVANIAEEIGYPDAYHFSRRFKAITGRSPLRYRQNMRGGAAG